MPSSLPLREALNPLEERELIDAQKKQAWKGLPLTWIQAAAHVQDRGHVLGKSVIAMIECGSARAEMSVARLSSAYDLTADSLAVFAAGTEVDASTWQCRGVRRLMLELDGFEIFDPEIAAMLKSRHLQTTMDFRDRELAQTLRLILQEVLDGSPHGRLYAESLSLGVATRALRHVSAATSTARDRGTLSLHQRRVVVDRIEAQLSGDLSLTALAATAGLSQAQFVRLFRNTFGCSAHRFVLDARVRKARSLLVGTKLPLSAIASDVGFASQSHMTATFTRLLGVTPGDLRRA